MQSLVCYMLAFFTNAKTILPFCISLSLIHWDIFQPNQENTSFSFSIFFRNSVMFLPS